MECWADELKSKLDAALEENIILHSEHDQFKQEIEEAMQRLNDELEETKHEVASKEKIITRLTMHRDFLLKTAYNAQDDLNNNVLDKKIINSNSNKILTPLGKNKKIPEKFMQSYSNSFINNIETERKLTKDENNVNDVSKDEYIIKNFNEFDRSFGKQTFILNKLDSSTIENTNNKQRNANNLSNDNITFEKSEKKEPKRISAMGLEKYLNRKASFHGQLEMEEEEDEEENNFIKTKIDLELQNILDNRRNFIINTLTQENFSFDLVALKQLASFNLKNNQIPHKFNENIDLILSKIQERKEKVMKQKKVMQSKLEKIGIKIS